MTCPRPGCRGLVIPYRDAGLPGWPVYCINCGWYGDRHLLTDTDPVGLQVYMAPMKPDGARRPRLTAEERLRRASPEYVPDEKDRLFREKVSQAMRLSHARRGHKLSDPFPDLPSPSRSTH